MARLSRIFVIDFTMYITIYSTVDHIDRYYTVLEHVCWASFLELWNLMESLNDVDSSTTLSTPRVAHEV